MKEKIHGLLNIFIQDLNKLEATWLAVIEFIKWYKTQIKQEIHSVMVKTY